MAAPQPSITRLLQRWRDGDARALEQLAPLVYTELRRLASSYLRRERPNHTLQPTELVHEAFVRLIRQDTPDYRNRAHFMAIAAVHMRQILVDHARRRGRAKRGGGTMMMALADTTPAPDAPIDLVELDAALTALGEFDVRKGRIIEMHFFGGMRFEDIAVVLGVHVNTVARDARLARAWLHERLRA
jgi:RNA polymerase sigma factor (TIGR02999 family)